MVRRASIGVDPGKLRDPSAIVVVEALPQARADGGAEDVYEVRDLGRLPLKTSYPEVAARVARTVSDVNRILAAETEGRPLTPVLVMDATGAEAAADLFRVALSAENVILTEAVFSHGERIKGRPGMRRIQVGKAWLVNRLQVLLQTRRIRLPQTSEARALARELENFEIRVDAASVDTYGAFKVGTHDDLVVALGLSTLDAGRSAYEDGHLMRV